MRRLLATLGTLVVAAACGGGGTGPSPTGPSPTVPSPSPSNPVVAGWQGTVIAARRTLSGPLDTTQTFQGTVAFEPGNIIDTYDPPDDLLPQIPANAVQYVLTPGVLKLTHVGSVGPCSYGTGSWDVLMKKSDGYLTVAPNGHVDGRVTLPNTLFPVTVVCPGAGSAPGESGVEMYLVIAGTVAGTRVTGSMAPMTYAASTFTGSWDLASR